MSRIFRTLPSAALLALLVSTAGCVAPVGPVEVTRFQAVDAAPLGRGLITVQPEREQIDSLDYRTFAAAVGRQLNRVGYSEPLPGQPEGAQVATVRLWRERFRPGRDRSPVSVGVGGSTGSYGSGLGLGLGFDLSGPPPEMVDTVLEVTIADKASGKHIWEGRARFTVRTDSPLAESPLGAAKMTEALFQGFPGRSGETILVK